MRYRNINNTFVISMVNLVGFDINIVKFQQNQKLLKNYFVCYLWFMIFSTLNNIMTDKRKNMSPEILEFLMITNFN